MTLKWQYDGRTFYKVRKVSTLFVNCRKFISNGIRLIVSRLDGFKKELKLGLSSFLIFG